MLDLKIWSLLILLIPSILSQYHYYTYDSWYGGDYDDGGHYDYFFNDHYMDNYLSCDGSFCAYDEVYVWVEKEVPVPGSDLVEVQGDSHHITIESAIQSCAPSLSIKVMLYFTDCMKFKRLFFRTLQNMSKIVSSLRQRTETLTFGM